MFVVREIRLEDFDSVLKLASYLDSFNLPHDPVALRLQIEKSVKSFQDSKLSRADAIYMFVLEELKTKKIIGSSLVFGKHGTPDHPHTYLKVLSRVHEDEDLQIRREHQLLRFEYDTDGPSEIGGLILHPDYRGKPLGLGKHLSYSRFMYMGKNLDRFEKYVIAELLPPFRSDGSSELWEAYGKRFTGMNYQEADMLSRKNRNFIRNLFPQEDIYTCLFSIQAQQVIGETHEQTKPVRHMLEKIGFSYLEAVDPFDGGPHYGAKTREVTLIKRMKSVALSSHVLEDKGNMSLVSFQGRRGFGCLFVHSKVEDNRLLLTSEARAVLEAEDADGENLQWISPL